MDFYISEISEKTLLRMKNCGMLDHIAAMPPHRLREVFIKHYNFMHEVTNGSIIVMDVFANDCKNLFHELLSLKFPLHSVQPICHFDADDDISMKENNSSAYNPRMIAGTSDISIHAYGAAIDINPVQNPYVKLCDPYSNDLKIYPAQGKHYLNRRYKQAGMVEDIVDDVKKAGFSIWGGEWVDRRIDYHHFQAPLLIAYLCSTFDPESAHRLYDLYQKNTAFFDARDDFMNEIKDLETVKAPDIMINDFENLIDNGKKITEYF